MHKISIVNKAIHFSLGVTKAPNPGRGGGGGMEPVPTDCKQVRSSLLIFVSWMQKLKFGPLVLSLSLITDCNFPCPCSHASSYSSDENSPCRRLKASSFPPRVRPSPPRVRPSPPRVRPSPPRVRPSPPRVRPSPPRVRP